MPWRLQWVPSSADDTVPQQNTPSRLTTSSLLGVGVYITEYIMEYYRSNFMEWIIRVLTPSIKCYIYSVRNGVVYVCTTFIKICLLRQDHLNFVRMRKEITYAYTRRVKTK
jgi:hypothetical protein